MTTIVRRGSITDMRSLSRPMNDRQKIALINAIATQNLNIVTPLPNINSGTEKVKSYVRKGKQVKEYTRKG